MADASTNAGRKRNWWKAGFFVALIAFECAREVAVLEAAADAQPSTMKLIFGSEDFVSAQGRWIRSDGGSAIVPGTVSIECHRNEGRCLEASVTASDRHFSAPDLSWYDATFTSDGVTYINDNPDCARYAVRIDTTQKRAFATRDRKTKPANPNCKLLEPRVAMELGDGYIRGLNSLEGHFVPLLSLIRGGFELFE